MSDARRLVMTRDQVAKVTDGNHQRIKEFEKLLGAISSDPVEPITVAITGNTTYTLANDRGTQTILIPEAMLKASAGGPFTLTITTGVGDSVVVPIAASGDTILSGDLLFDIYIDSSGNVISNVWSIAGSNTLGWYQLDGDGSCHQRGSKVWTGNIPASSFSAATFFFDFPRAWADTSYIVTAWSEGHGAGYVQFAYNYNAGASKTTDRVTTGGLLNVYSGGAIVANATSVIAFLSDGRWR